MGAFSALEREREYTGTGLDLHVHVGESKCAKWMVDAVGGVL